ncbi:TSUP family transporter [Massilia sp. W12]|uniref:TSUP family transporter n=1 Tax=Massilia sp. W12 TaxID=3126507 RepID=UPI0030CD30B8
MDFALLAVAAFVAGLVDAVVGGGGLIQVPALFSVLRTELPATVFGTNKLASICGTSAAAVNFLRQVKITWRVATPAALSAFLFSMLGAYAVIHIPPDFLRKSLPFILLAVGAYTLAKKDFGKHHQPRLHGRRELILAAFSGAVIGFYDGFFGPGTGSFLVFVFVRVFGFDFIAASAVAKIVNISTNLAALMLFGYHGHVLWMLGLMMAVCQIAGSLTGSRLALKYGTGFVRKLFLFVVFALICKTTYDAFLR